MRHFVSALGKAFDFFHHRRILTLSNTIPINPTRPMPKYFQLGPLLLLLPAGSCFFAFCFFCGGYAAAWDLSYNCFKFALLSNS